MNHEYRKQLEVTRLRNMTNDELIRYLESMDFEIRRLYSDVYIAELLARLSEKN